MSLTTPPAPEDPAGSDLRPWLSAAADGELESLDRACRAWRDDHAARATWHEYHLIGDVMRSGELASPPARDAAFLGRLRVALAAEPVVLAPQPAPAVVKPRAPWRVPAAVAAGFMAVAGVLVVSRLSTTEPAGPTTLAAASGAGGMTRASLGAYTPVSPELGDRTLIRDARLDEYLRAHQAARGGMAAAVPVSALRRVEVDLPSGGSR